MEATTNEFLSMVREALLVAALRRAHRPDIDDDSRCRVVYVARPAQSTEVTGGAA